jgi:hypothetical protein
MQTSKPCVRAALAIQVALPLTAEHLEALQEHAQRLLGLLVQARIELEVGQNLEANVARLEAGDRRQHPS